jgi:curved DNA-binding protein CbpA
VTSERRQDFVYHPADLSEDVDLDVERRKEILFAEAHLSTFTHWQLLELPWNAPAEAVRAAYLAKVKVFHPDRYAGKRLGSYRGRLERVFRQLTDARDVLSDETRRAEYARRTAGPAEFAKLEARKLDGERRADERRARLARQNPLLARAGRIAELVARGKQALQEDRFTQAANDLQLALGLDPTHAEAAGLAREARRRASAQRAAEAYDRGLQAEIVGRAGAALAAYRDALVADPTNVRAAAAAARAALQLGDVAEARGHADVAVRTGPRVGLAHEALGLVLDAEGSKREARRALEKALELDPRLETAKERLKKLRWSFLG